MCVHECMAPPGGGLRAVRGNRRRKGRVPRTRHDAVAELLVDDCLERLAVVRHRL